MTYIKNTFLIVVFLNLFPHILQAENQKFVFSTHDFAPFFYYNGKRFTGPFFEIVNEACGILKAKCVFKHYPNRRAKHMLKNNLVHGSFPFGWNREREKWLYFSIPLVTSEYGFFVRSDSKLDFHQLHQLENYKVGVFGPSNTSNSLQKLRQQMIGQNQVPFNIDMHPNAKGAGILKLAAKRFDTYYSNKALGEFHIKRLNLGNIHYAGTQKQVDYFIVFSRYNNQKPEVKRFNRSLIRLHQRGFIQQVLKKYDLQPAAITTKRLKKYNVMIAYR